MGNYNGEPADAITIQEGFLRLLGPGIVIDGWQDSDPMIRVIGLCPIDEGEEHDRKDLSTYAWHLQQLKDIRKKKPNQKIMKTTTKGLGWYLRVV